MGSIKCKLYFSCDICNNRHKDPSVPATIAGRIKAPFLIGILGWIGRSKYGAF